MLRLPSIIFSQPWAIHPNYAHSQFPLLERIINGKYDDQDFSQERASYHPSYAVLGIGAAGITPLSRGSDAGGASLFKDAPQGSIAMIPLKGALMKQDQFCGPVGTATISKWLSEAGNNPNIIGVVLVSDTPGGSVDGTESLANTINDVKLKKPVVAFVDGMACSAGYWAISACDHIIISGETAVLGSIGTMCTVMDFTKALKKMGVKDLTTYAPDSTSKNVEMRALIKDGNAVPLENMLTSLNNVFKSNVTSNRGDKLNAKDKTILSGAVFLGSDAVDAGLADEIGSLDSAIECCFDLADKKNNSSTTTTNNTMKKTILKACHPALLALLGLSVSDGKDIEVELSSEQVDLLNTQAQKVIDLQASFDTLSSDNTKAVADLGIANLEIDRLKVELSQKNAVGRTVAIVAETTTEDDKNKFTPTGDAEFDKQIEHALAVKNFDFGKTTIEKK